MAKRRRWEEELEREGKPQLARQLAELDEGKRAGVLAELQQGGNRALQQVVAGPQLQREAAPVGSAPRLSRPYMNIDEIRGPVERKGYEGWFLLEQDYELDVSAPTDKATGLPRGKREYSDLKVVVRKSAGVTPLRRAIVENKVIKQIVIVTPLSDDPSKPESEKTTLANARVVGVKDLGNGNVEIRFVFEAVSWDAGELSAVDKPTEKSY